MNRDEPPLPHVGEQDPDHAERKIQVGGQVSDRGRQAAHPQQREVLGLETFQVGRGSADGGDHGH
jgi:hypothetical protein